jgi:hypothetical protein
MPRAFILVNVEPGAEEQAIKLLKGIEGVEESYVYLWRLRPYGAC